jgi:hypothetical protein
VIADGRGRTEVDSEESVCFFHYIFFLSQTKKGRKGQLHILFIFNLKIYFLYGLYCWFNLFYDCILNVFMGVFLLAKLFRV